MHVLLVVLLQFLMLVATRKSLRSSVIVSNMFENSLMYQYLSEAIQHIEDLSPLWRQVSQKNES